MIAIRSLGRTEKHLPMSPGLGADKDGKHSIMDKAHTINKSQTIHEMANISKEKRFNTFMTVEDALLKILSRGRGRKYHTAPASISFLL